MRLSGHICSKTGCNLEQKKDETLSDKFISLGIGTITYLRKQVICQVFECNDQKDVPEKYINVSATRTGKPCQNWNDLKSLSMLEKNVDLKELNINTKIQLCEQLVAQDVGL